MAGAVTIAILAGAIVVLLPYLALAPAGGAASSSQALLTPDSGTARGEVLGPLMSDGGAPGTATADVEPTDPASITEERPETFDDLPMHTRLDASWSVTRGDVSLVTLVALPSAVDRSMRLESGPSGVTVCRGLGAGAEVSVVVDVLLESRARLDIVVPSSPEAWVVTLTTDAGDADGVGIESSHWHELRIDRASGSWQLSQLRPADASEQRRGTAAQRPGSAPGSFCLSLAAGGTGAVLIDSIEISQP